MQAPITMTFHHVDPSGALRERARKLGSRLGRLGACISRCHMTFEGPGNQSNGAHAPYVVRIDLTVPNAHIHADSLGVEGAGHADIFLALRDALNNARRQLRSLHSKTRHPIRTGQSPLPLYLARDKSAETRTADAEPGQTEGTLTGS